MAMKKIFLLIALPAAVVAAVVDVFPQPEAESYLRAYYKPVKWQDIPGFDKDQPEQARPAMLRSCAALLNKPADRHILPLRHKPGGLEGTVQAWWPFCAALHKRQSQADVSEVSIYSLLKTYLQPYVLKEKNKYLSPLGLGRFWPESQGLFTGYYEPVVPGSYFKTEQYNVPLYGLPEDVLTADLGLFDPDLAGQRIVARAENGRLVPYHSRADIDQGALNHQEPLLWLKDPVDKFFLQIQGSGRVKLPGGKYVFVGYAGVNGHAYTAIGRYMVQQGYMALEDVSMQSIRTWLNENPDKLTEVLHQNESYVFFTIREDGPYGTQGVLLTPERSLAVDRRVVPLGAPVFLDAGITATGDRFRKLMVAQDTGGAIKGAIRGDIYFGYGDRPAELAGMQKDPGRLFVLLPKGISVTNEVTDATNPN